MGVDSATGVHRFEVKDLTNDCAARRRQHSPRRVNKLVTKGFADADGCMPVTVAEDLSHRSHLIISSSRNWPAPPVERANATPCTAPPRAPLSCPLPARHALAPGTRITPHLMTVFLPLEASSPTPHTPAFLVSATQPAAQLQKVIKAIMKARRIAVVCGAWARSSLPQDAS